MIDWDVFGNFHFLRPVWLGLMVAVLMVVVAIRALLVKRSNYSIIAPHLRAALAVESKNRSYLSPQFIVLLLLSLISVALAGPTWERQVTPLTEDQANLVIALDLSLTMQQTDIQPSRLERSKQKILDLVELRGSARTSIIVFSGSAHQLIPLSNDPDVIHQFVASIKPQIMPAGAGSLRTQADKIIPLLDLTLSNIPTPASIVLISDSMNAQSGLRLQEYFSTSSHQLLVLGVGLTETVDTSSSKEVQNQFDNVHIPLQGDALKKLANESKGRYQEVTVDKQDIRRINSHIDRHLALVGDRASPWEDKGYILLFPIALLALLLFRRGWVVQFVCVLVCVGFQPSNSVLAQSNTDRSLSDTISESILSVLLNDNQMGRYYFERADYERAARYFDDPIWKATSYYYAEKFNIAAELYKQYDTLDANFNYANALAQGQHYVSAVRAYTAVLDSDPEHRGAQQNLQILQDIVDAIHDMSANQQSEAGAKSKSLDGAPQRGDGAEQNNIANQEKSKYTAEQILSDTQIRDMWMRQVQQDPARFLAAKFQLQLNRQQELNKSINAGSGIGNE